MIRQNVTIDFTKMIINIDDRIIKPENEEYYDLIESPEQELFNNPNLFITQDSQLFNKKITCIVEKSAVNNPEVGCIFCKEFCIHLKDDIPIRSRIYPVLYKYYDLVKEEIRKLERLDIICKSNSVY
ncbi:hypothetical protein HERIO_1925 [Hepatospora eriocheir]|uniref:Uncharacterized protein n=1 Tax=Hepatospora eriocheir TaxID=1081669 RepID=A0A1X0Q8M5_9MICR|nr:hypothetical protein HERIO_1925 [Hepatospora eriocheir]